MFINRPFLILILFLVVEAFLLGQNPCSDPVDGGEEPGPGSEGEPGEIDDSGCYDENNQWVPGGFLVSFWCCGGELLGVECVAGSVERQYRTAKPLNRYLLIDTTQWGVHWDTRRQPTMARVRARHLLILGVDFDNNGLLNRPELLLGPWDAPNGFVVLARFDAASQGGNGDGFLDARDAIWSQLFLREVDSPFTRRPESIGIHRIEMIPRSMPWRNLTGDWLQARAYGPDWHPSFGIFDLEWKSFSP